MTNTQNQDTPSVVDLRIVTCTGVIKDGSHPKFWALGSSVSDHDGWEGVVSVSWGTGRRIPTYVRDVRDPRDQE